ncbi:hypothetical protein CcaverHIS631_0212330 [Cutaneotrichosporon cavernicola]|nr:hypothetical protein CcaverHIS631_0212330 [Cutaneotrichosporon cavernicola]
MIPNDNQNSCTKPQASSAPPPALPQHKRQADIFQSVAKPLPIVPYRPLVGRGSVESGAQDQTREIAPSRNCVSRQCFQ